MSEGLVSLMFGAGVAGWAYSKLSRRTGGGNAGPAFKTAAAVFVVVFVFFYTLLKWVLHV